MATRDRDSGSEKKQSGSSFQLWWETAWEEWVRPLGVIFLCAVAYVLYKFDLISEGTAGALFVIGVVLGTLAAGALPAWPLCRTATHRGLLAALVALWALGTGYPAIRAALPPRAIAVVHLTTAQPSQKVQVGADGPYEIAASGRLKQIGAAEVEARYALKVEGGGHSDEVSGELKRALVHLRTSRRGGTSTSVQEHTEVAHRLPSVRGPELTISTDAIDESFEEGLEVAVRRAGPNPVIFFVLGGLAVLLALVLDVLLPLKPDAKAPKSKPATKTYLAAASGVALVFSIDFPTEGTPHSLVRPAVGALILALVVGGLGGWLLAGIVRVFAGPKRRTR
jgi:hypothetical protein